jgi:hypothetical protein
MISTSDICRQLTCGHTRARTHSGGSTRLLRPAQRCTDMRALGRKSAHSPLNVRCRTWQSIVRMHVSFTSTAMAACPQRHGASHRVFTMSCSGSVQMLQCCRWLLLL